MKEKEYSKEELDFIKKYGMHNYIKIFGEEHIYNKDVKLEDVVYELERLRRNGKIYVFAVFNGEYLFSFDETYDSAFRKVYKVSRKTWLENLARERRWQAAMEAQKEQENIRKLLKKD